MKGDTKSTTFVLALKGEVVQIELSVFEIFKFVYVAIRNATFHFPVAQWKRAARYSSFILKFIIHLLANAVEKVVLEHLQTAEYG